MNPLSLYINIPYCSNQCNFCNKVNHFIPEKSLTPYYEALIKEIVSARGQFDDYTVSSVYIGGGVPTCARPTAISGILDAIKESFILEENVEVTMKMLPGTLNGGYVPIHLQDGINRVSIDFVTQDFFTKEFLKYNTYDENLIMTIQAFNRNHFKNYSFDLLYGLPGQTKESLKVTLDFILEKEPAHISVYPLVLHENLPLYKKYLENKEKLSSSPRRRLPGEEECSDLFSFAKDYLKAKGFNHYLDHHFALQGFECKHFLSENNNMISFGLGCSSKIDGIRYQTTSDLPLYLKSSGEFQEITLNIEKSEPEVC